MKARYLAKLAGLAALATLGCGPTFDPPTEIKTLRILGVQKDKPYAQPGDDVNLSLLWYDGTSAGEATPPRQVQIAWLGGCLNPPADSYQGCFQQYAAAFGNGGISGDASGMAPSGGITLGYGKTFTTHLPTDAENGAPVLHPNQDPRLPLYGLSYVFFSACAGHIVPGDEHFPIYCRDDQNRDLGPNDFVLGYAAIYFFEPRANGEPYLNANPITTGIYFGPQSVEDATCLGDACLGTCDDDGECVNQPPADVDCGRDPTLCIPTCPADGDPQKCPPYNVRLAIDTTTFEKDDVTNDAYGENYGEQMWLDYYSTRGDFHSATKLLNDATTGYNAQNGTQFYAPAAQGPVELWVVMHDNRGGVSWAGTTLMVQ